LNSVWVDLLGSEVRYRGNEYKTRCIEAGSGDTLILIHGVGGHAEAYSRNLMRLAQSFHTVAIDMVWHGLSGKPPYTIEMVPTYAKQVIDLLDSMSVDKASVEGESLGGWVTMWLALHYPDRINKVILNTAAGVHWKPGTVDEHPDTGVNLLRERSLAAIHDPNKETVRKRLEWLMAKPDRVTDELVDIRHTLYSLPETQASLTKVFENSFGGPTTLNRIEEEELGAITVPTLVFWTENNPGAGPDAGQRIASHIPGSQFYCMADAAHWPQWEHPEEHDRVITAFLKGQKVG
jgi:pimeloyl-ACP methyl ester carboxylesterase